MTINEFLTYWNGIYCDYDGVYGDQCFDLANAYSRWIGGQRFTGATADLIFNQAGDFYTQISNTPTGFPIKGDIVVWNWPHVGICTGNKTDANQLEVLEQNDPTNSNCHFKSYNYVGVLGWLRPKVLPQDLQIELDQVRADRDKNWNSYTACQNNLTTCTMDLKTCQNAQISPVDGPTSLLNQIKAILWGKGYWWTIVKNLKKLLPK